MSGLYKNTIHLQLLAVITTTNNNIHLQLLTVITITNNNMYIVVYSQHPYCCVNNIVLTRFMKQSHFHLRMCSLNLFNSYLLLSILFYVL